MGSQCIRCPCQDIRSTRPHAERCKSSAYLSLSALDIFVGVVGHILLNLKIPEILTLAFGQASPPTYPSWIPYWQELGTFKLDTEIQLAIRVTSEFEEAFEKRTDSHPFWTERRESIKLFSVYLPNSLEDTQSSHRTAPIDASNACLSITLIHLLRIKSELSLMLRSEGSFAAFKISTLSCGVYLLTEDIELDQVLPPGPIHIFILPRKVDKGCLLLFMQEVDTRLVKTCRLVVCCRCYEIGFTSSETARFSRIFGKGSEPPIRGLPGD
jgi:hypothetical protein